MQRLQTEAAAHVIVKQVVSQQRMMKKETKYFKAPFLQPFCHRDISCALNFFAHTFCPPAGKSSRCQPALRLFKTGQKFTVFRLSNRVCAVFFPENGVRNGV